MDEKHLQSDIKKRLKKKLTGLLKAYSFDPEVLESIIRWKPIVLMLGNYSSGKSTLINEIIGQEIQRTGQAPTDDSFTVITAPAAKETAKNIPGSTVIADEKLPFSPLKRHGKQLIAHLEMKLLESPALQDLAIIDSPGMLDSVTEKDRDYDYTGVIGDLAKLADLVVLMFDPHKAGTIKETYNAIRTTLPETALEDRIIFVMSRIDECDNLSDLVRSYGTLCWNLSQMTGRKDIPRIFLTFSPTAAQEPDALGVWIDERQELKEKILGTPTLRINHILENVDKQVNELKMVIEAMTTFSDSGRRLLNKSLALSLGAGVFLFFFLDVITRELTGFPEMTFLGSLFTGAIPAHLLILPFAGLVTPLIITSAIISKWLLPRHINRCMADPEQLIDLDTQYREHVWAKVRDKVLDLLTATGVQDLLFPAHRKNLGKVEKFIEKDLRGYYAKIT